MSILTPEQIEEVLKCPEMSCDECSQFGLECVESIFETLKHYVSENKKLKESVKSQKEYIEFLGKQADSYEGFLYAHGITPSDSAIKKGLRLRAKIQEVDNDFYNSSNNCMYADCVSGEETDEL